MSGVHRPRLKLIPVYCVKCGRFLAGIPVFSSAVCPSCNIWNFPEGAPPRPVKPDVPQPALPDLQERFW
ncbi:MAG: hypothetical protein GC154_07145 [bacterium]|nr:hypothetical protein [bacterium]